MTQKPPAQLVAVAAVGGVGKEPFLQVGAQHLEEFLLGRDAEVGKLCALQPRY
jgi:hypothetical protein